MSAHADQLRQIKRLDQFVGYLRDELGWPIGSDSIEDITYDYNSDELGLDTGHAAKPKHFDDMTPAEQSAFKTKLDRKFKKAKRRKGVSPNNLQFSVFFIATTNNRIMRQTHLWLN